MRYFAYLGSGALLLAAAVAGGFGGYYGYIQTADSFGVTAGVTSSAIFVWLVLGSVVGGGAYLLSGEHSAKALHLWAAGALLGLATLTFNSLGIHFFLCGLFAVGSVPSARLARSQMAIPH
jgi:hypothetical protein